MKNTIVGSLLCVIALCVIIPIGVGIAVRAQLEKFIDSIDFEEVSSKRLHVQKVSWLSTHATIEFSLNGSPLFDVSDHKNKECRSLFFDVDIRHGPIIYTKKRFAWFKFTANLKVPHNQCLGIHWVPDTANDVHDGFFTIDATMNLGGDIHFVDRIASGNLSFQNVRMDLESWEGGGKLSADGLRYEGEFANAVVTAGHHAFSFDASNFKVNIKTDVTQQRYGDLSPLDFSASLGKLVFSIEGHEYFLDHAAFSARGDLDERGQTFDLLSSFSSKQIRFPHTFLSAVSRFNVRLKTDRVNVVFAKYYARLLARTLLLGEPILYEQMKDALAQNMFVLLIPFQPLVDFQMSGFYKKSDFRMSANAEFNLLQNTSKLDRVQSLHFWREMIDLDMQMTASEALAKNVMTLVSMQKLKTLPKYKNTIGADNRLLKAASKRAATLLSVGVGGGILMHEDDGYALSLIVSGGKAQLNGELIPLAP